jgi:hypothetical protein
MQISCRLTGYKPLHHTKKKPRLPALNDWQFWSEFSQCGLPPSNSWLIKLAFSRLNSHINWWIILRLWLLVFLKALRRKLVSTFSAEKRWRHISTKPLYLPTKRHCKKKITSCSSRYEPPSTTLHQAPFGIRYTPFSSNAPRHFTLFLIFHSFNLRLKPIWLAYL